MNVGAGRTSSSPIDVHPQFAPSYAAFFFQGLADRLGDAKLRYTTKQFPSGAASDLLLLHLREPDDRRICIAPDDRADIDVAALQWCDIYGKVNLDRCLVPVDAQQKVIALGPTFGVRWWGPVRSATEFLRVRAAAPRLRAPVGGRGFAAQRRRVAEREYQASRSDDDYVFFAAWPWKKHDAVNPPRAEFVRACQARAKVHSVRFEGGFAPRRRDDMPELSGLFAPRRYLFPEYFEKTRRSAVVFNTPAVHECLGWKLGEFLALGKAIISIPLTRELPAPLEHGIHAHFVDGSRASIDDALDLLLRDRAYRESLERNARAYYDAWVRPDRVVGRLLGE